MMSDTNERPAASTSPVNEPVAWAVRRDDGRLMSILFRKEHADASRKSWDARENWAHAVVPLYRSPTLTDAEREAVAWCRDNITAMAHPSSAFARIHAATLRALLERLK